MDKAVMLSSNEFKALASETRTGIIKLLQQRNHTLSELSKKLQMAAPTIKQHLAVLQNAEMVEAMDEGRKWKYYSLTRKGKNIFATEPPTNILIVLSVTIIALAGMLYLFVSIAPLQAAPFGAITPQPANLIIEDACKQCVAGTTTAVKGTTPQIEPAAEGAEKAVPAAGQAAGLPIQAFALLAAIVAVSLITGLLLGKLKS